MPALTNLRVPAKHIRRLRRQVVETSDKERLALPGLDPNGFQDKELIETAQEAARWHRLNGHRNGIAETLAD